MSQVVTRALVTGPAPADRPDADAPGRHPVGRFWRWSLDRIAGQRSRRCRRVALALLAAAACAPAHAGVWLQLDAGAHAAPVRRIAVDAAAGIAVTASDDKTARVWSLRDGAPLRVLRPPVGGGEIGRLYGVALHPTQPVVAVGGTSAPSGQPGHAIWLFDPHTGRFLRRIDAQGGDIKRLSWSQDGQLLVAGYAGDPAVRAFDDSGRMRFEQRMTGDVYGVATGARGQVAAASMDGAVYLFERSGDGLRQVRRIDTGGGQPVALSFSPDGSRIVVGFYARREGASVYDTASGARVLRLAFDDMPYSNLMAVAWSADGRVIHASGIANADGRNVALRRYDAATGRLVDQAVVADDSVSDLAALPDGDGAAWCSFEGSWGVQRGAAAALKVAGSVPDVRGASQLRVSPDGRVVRWAWDGGRTPVAFDLRTRALLPDPPSNLVAPVTRLSLFQAARDFENSFRPVVGTSTLVLGRDEVSRALGFIGDSGSFALGTSRALVRFDEQRRETWRVPLPTEAKAVNVADGGRTLVTVMADGTVRWWRASDGALLLSLLVMPGGRWVAWTPAGHYDASAGAESLLGWLIDRDGGVPDHFPVSRFRDRYLRPDVIDRVLDAGSPERALEQADRERPAGDDAAATLYAGGAAPARPADPPPAAAPRPVDEVRVVDVPALPPILLAGGPALLAAAPTDKVLAFAVKSLRDPSTMRVEVRSDGRLLPDAAVRMPPRGDGESLGEVRLAVPTVTTTIELLVRDGEVTSAPLVFRLQREKPPPLEPQRASGRLRLLAIGVSEYRNPNYRLVLPSKDARDFAETMARQKGRLYRDVTVRLITDRDATRAGVLEGLEWLRQGESDDDVTMLFIAGHGLNDARGRYYFVPHDGDAAALARTAVPDVRVRTALTGLRGRAMLFLDTCYAGSVNEVFRTASRSTSRVANDLSAPENAVIVFASSADREESIERDEWGNGAFTKALIEGLAGRALLSEDTGVTLRSLDAFLAREVARLTNGRQNPVSVIPRSIPDRLLATLRQLTATLQRWFEAPSDVPATTL